VNNGGGVLSYIGSHRVFAENTTVSFTYAISDGHSHTASATVSITLIATNTGP